MHTQIAQWSEASDARSIFLQCYSMMTGTVLETLGGGHYDDAPWVERLLHRFADYYFDALALYDADPGRAPAVWRIAHEATRDPTTNAVQRLLLGVNAHINYDLVLTLVDMLEPEWSTLDDTVRACRLADHRRINAIIARTVDAVQDTVIEPVEPSWDWVDRGLGPVDEWIASRVIESWRDEVWTRAQEMLACEGGEHREACRARVERATLERADALLFRSGIHTLGRLL